MFRKRSLDLIFQNLLHGLSVEAYRDFQATCTPEEWPPYEAKLLKQLSQYDDAVRIDIHLERQEFEKALRVFIASGDKSSYFDIRLPLALIQEHGATLEPRFPEEVVQFYQSLLKKAGTSPYYSGRSLYQFMAKVAVRLRGIYCDILKQPGRWTPYAKGLKRENMNRPAFQEVFTKALPDWKPL